MLKKILIVDDSKTIRQQVHLAFRKKYQIIEADDGINGVSQLENNPDIDIIISDVNMPNMGGLDMLLEIRNLKNSDLCQKPVIMLTTEGDANLIEKARSLGAKGWVVKPFKPQDLEAALSKIYEKYCKVA
jgi:two-component system chemotaxis response regulator CheY